uniref:Uncharacterized protein n=1 Tax=Kalanchoe fedtschenkoi TaxID=63787 RepID=A0A7N0U6X9_KALFE
MGTLNQAGFNPYHCCTQLGGLMTSATMMEKRQVFLRSYQFSRKMSVSEKMKRSLVRVKRVMWLKLRSARKVVWSKLRRFSLCHRRRRRFVPLRSPLASATNCFW